MWIIRRSCHSISVPLRYIDRKKFTVKYCCFTYSGQHLSHPVILLYAPSQMINYVRPQVILSQLQNVVHNCIILVDKSSLRSGMTANLQQSSSMILASESTETCTCHKSGRYLGYVIITASANPIVYGYIVQMGTRTWGGNDMTLSPHRSH